jgi:hypothetical protein
VAVIPITAIKIRFRRFNFSSTYFGSLYQKIIFVAKYIFLVSLDNEKILSIITSETKNKRRHRCHETIQITTTTAELIPKFGY